MRSNKVVPSVDRVNFVQALRKQWHKSFLIDFHRANGFFVVIGKFVIRRKGTEERTVRATRQWRQTY